MDWFLYAVALPVALLVLGSAGCAVHWAAKHGQSRALWMSVRSLLWPAQPDVSDTLLGRNEDPGKRPSAQT